MIDEISLIVIGGITIIVVTLFIVFIWLIRGDKEQNEEEKSK